MSYETPNYNTDSSHCQAFYAVDSSIFPGYTGGMETENLLTMDEAAARIGVSLSAIRNATQEGRLPFVRAFGRKLIEREALAEYRARTQPDGVPPKGRPPRRTATHSRPV